MFYIGLVLGLAVGATIGFFVGRNFATLKTTKI